jgi:hypothetical protein
MLAVLDDRPVTLATWPDLLVGIVDAHLNGSGDRKRGFGLAKRTWGLAVLGAICIAALIKFVPVYPSTAGPPADRIGNVTVVSMKFQQPFHVHHLTCTGQKPLALTVKRGTLLVISCSFHVEDRTRALIDAGRNFRGTVHYLLAYKVGQGTIRLGHSSVTVTVRP